MMRIRIYQESNSNIMSMFLHDRLKKKHVPKRHFLQIIIKKKLGEPVQANAIHFRKYRDSF